MMTSKSSTIPISAVFAGTPKHLQRAYPPSLREEIGKSALIHSPDIPGQDWRNHRQALRDADVVFSTWGVPVLDEEFLAYAPRLKAVFHAAGSIKTFINPAAYHRGILISSAWRANALSVADFTVGAILLSLKQFWRYAELTRQTRTYARPLNVAGTYGSRVGVVSLGAIGQQVIRKLGAFDLEIIGYDPYPSGNLDLLRSVRLVDLEKIFRSADVVTLHSPFLAETENMITESLVLSMKAGATLINTSSGRVIDQEGLCRALACRPDLTAILDVAHPEPPEYDSLLYTLENVIMTPHIAGSLDAEVSRMGRWMVNEFEAWLAQQPLEHLVTAEMLARMA